MQEDVEAVEGKIEELDYEWLFNVRFRREDATVFDPPVPFAKVPRKIAGRSARYQLMDVDVTDLQFLPTDRSREGTTDLPDDLSEQSSGGRDRCRSIRKRRDCREG